MIDAPDSMLIHCGSCRHEWFALKLPMQMVEAAGKLKNLECPHCRRMSKIFCGPAPVQEEMTEASRVQALLNAQNAETNLLKNRIAQLEDALRELLSLGQWGMNDLARTIAREALGERVEETRKT